MSLATHTNMIAERPFDQDTAVSLEIRWPSGDKLTLPIDQPDFIIGRGSGSTFAVPVSYNYVSGNHFALRETEDGYMIEDLGSTNGTSLNGRDLSPYAPTAIKNGDVIRVGIERFGISISFTFHNPNDQKAPLSGFGTMITTTSLLKLQRLTIGRDPQCDIVLESPTISRVHAYVERIGEGYHTIRLAEGAIPFLVNQFPMTTAKLQPGDSVQFGPHLLTYDGATLQQFDSQGYRLDVVRVSKEVKTKTGPLRILDNISFSVLPREFVALVGGSGAGKSTLLDALNGFRPAQGEVLINGRNLYTHYDDFRNQIGYVPQYDILPTSLKVDDALRLAAKLRLPTDVTADERERRIAEALDTVEMNSPRIRETRISRLSGGQRKRVSIAAELIADPKIFFLDEPSSGLDPGLEKKLMYVLRRMADEGRTIIVITHATANIVQVDNVAFLSQGRLVYYGPPQEVDAFFDVADFADVYERIQDKGPQWQAAFTSQNPALYQKYVVQRQQSRPQGNTDEQMHTRFSFMDGVRQFFTLSQRMVRLTLSDPIALFVSLLVMPLVGILQGSAALEFEMVGDPTILADAALAAERLTENYLPAIDSQIFVFGMAILAFLVGAFGGSQELLKERPIFLRERMVNLKLVPYLGSKLFVFASFAIVQCALYLLILGLQVELPSDGFIFKGFLEVLITLFLTVMVGIVTGLFISSVAKDSTTAVYLVLVVVFFQYIFGGAIHNLRDKPIEFQSYIAATRWATLAMGTTVDINQLAESTVVCGNEFELVTDNIRLDPTTGSVDPDSLSLRETDAPACTNRAVDPADLFLPYGNSASDLLRLWGIQFTLGAVFLILTMLMVKRLDKV